MSCAALSPIFDELRPTFVTLAKVDIEAHRDIAAKYDVTPENVPTFIVFKFGRATDKLEGIEELLDALQVNPDLDGMDRGTGSAGEASSASGASWAGAGLPRGYKDVTDQVEIPRCELLNVDTELGGIRTLLDKTKPGALAGKTADKDWVESDTDEQLMLFLPFKSAIKLHTLQVCSPGRGDAARTLRAEQAADGARHSRSSRPSRRPAATTTRLLPRGPVTSSSTATSPTTWGSTRPKSRRRRRSWSSPRPTGTPTARPASGCGSSSSRTSPAWWCLWCRPTAARRRCGSTGCA